FHRCRSFRRVGDAVSTAPIGTRGALRCQGRKIEFRVPAGNALEFAAMTVQRPKKTATWRAKVHPAFFDIADLNRDFEREHNWIDQECRRAWNAKNATNERRSEIREEFCRRNDELLATLDQRVVDINRPYAAIPT